MTEKELLSAAICRTKEIMGDEYDNVFESFEATTINGFLNI